MGWLVTVGANTRMMACEEVVHDMNAHYASIRV